MPDKVDLISEVLADFSASQKPKVETNKGKRNPFAPVEVVPAGKVVEAGKEKINLLDTSKQVLREYGDKTLKAFADFPNKEYFAMVVVGGLATIQTTTLGILSHYSPTLATDETERHVVDGINVFFTMVPLASSVGFYRAWLDKSFNKSQVK